MESKSVWRQINWLGVVLLAAGGAVIYLMPYVRSSYYDALIQGMGVDNTQLGIISSFFGLLTLACYFPGGWLADRFSAKKLLLVSFIINAFLGLWYSTLPGYKTLIFIHVLFGIFCTLTFWAAYIKATRLCAPPEAQGKAFGFVEGIRRVISMLIVFIGAWIFSRYVDDQVGGVQAVLRFYAATCAAVAVGIFFFMKDAGSGDQKTGASLKEIGEAAKIGEIWLIALIVMMAYFSFRSQDIMTPYATNLCGLSGTLAAVVSGVRYYGMGFMAIPGGLIGDRIGYVNTMMLGLGLVIATNLLFIAFPGTPATVMVFVTIMFAFMTAQFAMRGVYYAMLTEGKVPVAVTGIATGIIATVAYSPDVFAPLYSGLLLDAYGRDTHTGYNYIFMISIVTAIIGIGLCCVLKKRIAVKAAAQQATAA